MASEAITRNDLMNILNEVLPPTPSEYKKLLWTNPNPASDFAPQTLALDLSGYDEVEIVATFLGDTNASYSTRCAVGAGSNLAYQILNTATATNASTFINGVAREFTVSTSGITFGNGQMTYNGGAYTNWQARAIPYKIYGIKYERVQPPVLDAEIEVLATGITLYRIGRIRALHISDATGFTKSSLIPSADRPSADIQGVAIRTTNGNLATSFGRIVVGANGDVGALYSSVLNGSQTGFSVASSTDHIIGTVIWYVAE